MSLLANTEQCPDHVETLVAAPAPRADRRAYAAPEGSRRRRTTALLVSVFSLLTMLALGVLAARDGGVISAPPATATMTVEQLKNAAQPLSYGELARHPEAFTGKVGRFSGRVVQVMPSVEKGYALRVDVALPQAVEPAPILVWYDGAAGPVVADDAVTLYGPILGRQSYQTTRGEDITMPAVSAQLLEFNETR